MKCVFTFVLMLYHAHAMLYFCCFTLNVSFTHIPSKIETNGKKYCLCISYLFFILISGDRTTTNFIAQQKTIVEKHTKYRFLTTYL